MVTKKMLNEIDKLAIHSIHQFVDAIQEGNFVKAGLHKGEYEAYSKVVKMLNEQYWITTFSPFEAILWGSIEIEPTQHNLNLNQLRDLKVAELKKLFQEKLEGNA